MSKTDSTPIDTAESKTRFDSLHRQLTLAGREVDSIHDQGKSATSTMEGRKVLLFKGMFRTLEKYYTRFENLWIELQTISESFPSQDDKKFYNSVRGAYYQANASYETILAHEQAEKAVSPSIVEGRTIITNSRDSSLQPIPLPTFDGQLLEWPKFRDTFRSLIHEDERLSTIKKFHDLVRSLSGPASTIVSAFKIEEDNYDLAWKALEVNFENGRMLASAYLNKLINFPPIQKSTPENLKRFLIEVSDNVSAFKKLSIVDQSDFILFHLAVRNLDARTREQFEMAFKGTDFPKFDELSQFVRDRLLAVQLAESSYDGSSNSNKRQGDTKNQQPSTGKKSHVFITNDAKGSSTPRNYRRCLICNSSPNHNLGYCKKFRGATVDQRLQWIKNWTGCINCLSDSHSNLDSCPSKFHCRFCSTRHHSLLHKEPLPGGNASNQSNSKSGVTLNTLLEPASCKVLLGTAVAEIRDARGIYHYIRLVIDSGSSHSFITFRMLNRLGLKSVPFKKVISGIGDTPFSGAKGKVDCLIRSRHDGAKHLTTNAIVVNDITTYLPTSDLPWEIFKRYSKFALADPEFFKPSPIDFLLGADMFADILTGPVQEVDENLPKVLSTIFGDIVIGNIKDITSDGHLTALFASTAVDDLHASLTRFWEIEEPYIPAVEDPQNEICENHFKTTHYRNSAGQYVLKLPFTSQPPQGIADSASSSLKMFYNLESKLAKNSHLRQEYTKFMKDYIDLGHMTPTTNGSRYVIPHHPIWKIDRNQIKLRAVFNGSHSTNFGSLNDFLMVGPKLQNSIFLVLLNYRIYAFVFTCDVVRMYRGIWIDPEDRPYQHIYWREDPALPLQVYELNTVTYGLTPSPYQSLRTLHQLREDEGHNYPLANDVLVDDVYIDDYLTGSNSLESALELKSQLVGLLGKAGLTLSKWASNSKEILARIESKCNGPVPISMEDEIEPKIKLLGLQWDPTIDCFSYSINLPGPIYTKRAILSAVSKIYDPLGFLTPAVLAMKNFIQLIWKEGLHWDTKLSENMQTEWDSFISEIPHLAEIRIPRFVGSQAPCQFQVVGFSDASTKGYCAAIYLRTIVDDVTNSHLLIAKSKLAPIRTISVPRLELQAARLLAIVYKSIQPFLERISRDRLPHVFFTDSTIVLGWLSTPPYRLKTFVANRVTEIMEIIPFEHWRHVNSADNPSDCGSRGIMPSDLMHHSLWWHGPPWLVNPLEKWPIPSFSIPRLLPETKPIVALIVSIAKLENFVSWMNQFSSFSKLIRVVAVLTRAMRKRTHPLYRMEPLSVADIRYSTMCCIRAIQKFHFFHDSSDEEQRIKRSFGNLSPFRDGEGLWRVGGRLRHSNFSEDRKYPILLPSNSHFVNILVDYYHRIFLHASPSIIQAMIQIRYWISNLRRIVRKRTFRCLSCFKQNATSKAPIMADLPHFRVQGKHAFEHVGCDFAGPFLMRESLRRKALTSKVYLCLFVCMQTKALHLEAVTQLSTSAFIASLDRFTSRRGMPTNVYSDSGTNFVGAANLLKDLYRWLRESSTMEDIRRYALAKEITWHFNPPSAPHFGGLWESGVRSVKRLMRTSAGDTPLTYEELSTLFARFEAILNSRPLCPVSTDPEDVDYLTPGHFLVGGNLISYPEPSLLERRENSLDRWQLVKRCSQQFWSKWHTEYLTTLQKRVKWTKAHPNLQVGDLVIMKNPSMPVQHWPSARVTEVYPGSDGIVRAASVKTASENIYRRPVVQLVPLLPLNSSVEH